MASRCHSFVVTSSAASRRGGRRVGADAAGSARCWPPRLACDPRVRSRLDGLPSGRCRALRCGDGPVASRGNGAIVATAAPRVAQVAWCATSAQARAKSAGGAASKRSGSPAARVLEAEPCRMQGLACHAERRRAAIERIGRPEDGRATRGARGSGACGRCAACSASALKPVADGDALDVGARRLAARDDRHAHARAAGRGRSARRCASALRAATPCAIARYSRCTSRAAIARTSAVTRGSVLADDHQPRRVLVEPVHDAGARQRRGPRVIVPASRSAACPTNCRRPDARPAGRLVDHEQVLVFVHDGERHGLGPKRPALRRSAAGRRSSCWPARMRRAAAASTTAPSTVDAARARSAAADGCARTRAASATSDLVEPLAVRAAGDGRFATLDAGVVDVVAVAPRRRRWHRRPGWGPQPYKFSISAKASRRSSIAARFACCMRIEAILVALAPRSVGDLRRARARCPACDTTPPDDTARWTTERLYAEAKEEAATGNYERRSSSTSASRVAPPARCWRSRRRSNAPTAYWKSGEKAQALSTLERFIKLHPTSPALDYALYLQGLVNFNDNLGIFGSLARQDLSERDQQASRDSYQSFRQLVEQFPQSRYAEDARTADELHRQLARRLRGPRRALLLPSRRLRRRRQPRAAGGAGVPAARPSTEEALFIMAQSYDRLGLDELRDDAERVLKTELPGQRLLTTTATAQRKAPGGSSGERASRRRCSAAPSAIAQPPVREPARAPRPRRRAASSAAARRTGGAP